MGVVFLGESLVNVEPQLLLSPGPGNQEYTPARSLQRCHTVPVASNIFLPDKDDLLIRGIQSALELH